MLWSSSWARTNFNLDSGAEKILVERLTIFKHKTKAAQLVVDLDEMLLLRVAALFKTCYF
jgi:hypothetical protein